MPDPHVEEELGFTIPPVWRSPWGSNGRSAARGRDLKTYKEDRIRHEVKSHFALRI